MLIIFEPLKFRRRAPHNFPKVASTFLGLFLVFFTLFFAKDNSRHSISFVAEGIGACISLITTFRIVC